jgi:surface polysaccharide O-acyltransferase-like enzyme
MLPFQKFDKVGTRDANIDALKAVAAFSVLLIHFCPFPAPIRYPIEIAIRFAVPFFFMLNGYFFGLGSKRLGIKRQTMHTLSKTSKIYIVWWSIYLLFPSSGEIRRLGFAGSYETRIYRVTRGIEEFVFYGPTTHLWYFPALICAVLTTFLVMSLIDSPRIQWILASMFYISGVLGGSYAASQFAIELPLNSRHAAFFSFLPFFIGFLIATKGEELLSKSQLLFIGILIFAVGFIGHCLEVNWLARNFQQPINSHDYVFSTVIMSFGAFVCSLSKANFPGRKLLARFGKVSGGIFLIHILVLQRIPYLEPLIPPGLWHWISPFIAYSLSAYLCLFLLRVPVIKRFIPT